MTLKRILPFRWLPASWGLNGSAFAEAEINYLYTGQERDLHLAGLRFANDTPGLRRRILEIAHEYGEINEYEYYRGLLALDHSGLELENALIDLDRKYGKITGYDAAVEKLTKRLQAEPGDTAPALALGMLDIDLSFQRISRNEYDKRRATLREEPWISVINAGFNPKEGIDGVYFEFDWNAHWIEFLRINGYIGHTDEQIVDDWFADVCRSHVQAEMAVTR